MSELSSACGQADERGSRCVGTRAGGSCWLSAQQLWATTSDACGSRRRSTDDDGAHDVNDDHRCAQSDRFDYYPPRNQNAEGDDDGGTSARGGQATRWESVPQ